MEKINYSLNDIYNVRQPLAYKALMNIEAFVDAQEISMYKELAILYKFKNSAEIQEVFSKLGKYIDTPLGAYVKMEKALLLLNVSSDDSYGTYIHIEIFFNQDIDIHKLVDNIVEELKTYECNEVITKIKWQFNTKHGLNEIRLFDTNDTVIKDEAYPYIPGGTQDYFDKFLESNESVLILLGPPGTGKTRLIKGLMKYMAQRLHKNKPSEREYDELDFFNKRMFSVMYSNSQETYEDDAFFIEFIRSDAQLLVLEDIDFNLRPRDVGNTFMQKLLNASDGIVSLKNKKIVITTNLQSKQKTDSALLRCGRTFDIIETRSLNTTEAITLAKSLNKELTIVSDNKTEYTVAEVYTNKIDNQYKITNMTNA